MVDNKIMAAAKNEKYEHNKEIGSYKKQIFRSSVSALYFLQFGSPDLVL